MYAKIFLAVLILAAIGTVLYLVLRKGPCTANCKGKTCGSSDGCNGTCGCPSGKTCVEGHCVDPTPPTPPPVPDPDCPNGCPAGTICCSKTCCKGVCMNGECNDGFPPSCPMTSSKIQKVSFQGLKSGSYAIGFNHDQDTWYLSARHSETIPGGPAQSKSNTAYLLPSKWQKDYGSTWQYDSDGLFLTSKVNDKDVLLSAEDSCPDAKSICGNTSGSYKGGLSMLYDSEASAPKILMGENTIYSVSANAYIIPDVSQYPGQIPPGYGGCQRGYLDPGTTYSVITLTYTTDPVEAAVWKIIPK